MIEVMEMRRDRENTIKLLLLLLVDQCNVIIFNQKFVDPKALEQ